MCEDRHFYFLLFTPYSLTPDRVDVARSVLIQSSDGQILEAFFSLGVRIMGLTARLGWTRTTTWLALCGLNSALVYLLIFLLPFQLLPYYELPQRFLYDFQNASPALVGIGWIVLFQLYYIGYRLCPARATRPLMTLLVIFPLFFSLVLFFMYPLGANDIYEMIFRGHIFATRGASPFSSVPNMFADDPWIQYVWWRDISGAYGPVWEGLAAFTTKLMGGNLLANLFSYKAIMIAHYWAGMPLLYFALRAFRPEFAIKGLFLYAWNPMAQFDIAANAHTEGMLIFWLVAAVFLLIKKQHILALLALTVAILVKFIPVLLVPLFLVALWRGDPAKQFQQRVGLVMIALAGMGLLTVLLYLPFGVDSIITNIGYLASRDTLIHQSVPWMVYNTLQTLGLATPQAAQVVRLLSLLVVGGVVLWQIVRLMRSKADHLGLSEGVVRGSFNIFFVYLLLAMLYFQPWYILWMLPFVPFLCRGGYVEKFVVFLFTSLAAYFIWFYRWPIGSEVETTTETMLFWVIFPIPILVSLAILLYDLRKPLAVRFRKLTTVEGEGRLPQRL